MADAKSSPKAMDVVHAGATPPSPTSRPMIISNRPYMKVDPMLSPSGTAPTPASKPPATAPQEKVLTPDHPTQVSDKAGLPLNETPDKVSDKVVPPEESPVQTPGTTDAVETPTEKAADEPVAKPQDSKEDADSAKADAHDGEHTMSTDASLQDNILQAQVAQNTDDEAIDARSEEMEQLIAAKTYALPINKTGRRKKLVLLWILLFVLLGIVAVDVLADMRVFSLPLSIPHTNFFGN